MSSDPMSEGDVELCIESRDGTAQPAVLYLTPGERLGPIHVGATSKWQVRAAGVADQHAFLFFNGSQLFMQSVDVDTPVFAAGRALPMEWVVIEPPCDIQLGEARLWFGPADDADDDIDADVDAGVDADVDEDFRNDDSEDELPTNADETRLVPAHDLMASVARHRAKSGMSVNLPRRDDTPSASRMDDLAPTPPPSVPGPWRGEELTPLSLPTPSVSGSMPRTPTHDLPPTPSGGALPTQELPPPSAPTPRSPGNFSGLSSTTGAPLELADTAVGESATAIKLSWWRRASFPQKATAVLFLPMIASVVVIFTVEPQGQQGSAQTAATASVNAGESAQVAPSNIAAPDPSAVGPGDETDGEFEETEPDDEQLAASGDPASSALPSDIVPVASAPDPKIAKTTPNRRGKRKKTLQRQAVDAVAAASYEEAAKLYEELAKQEPDNKAYAAAAAITRAKAAAQKKK